jgi:nucleoside-diphosphate-sugar epimerase
MRQSTESILEKRNMLSNIILMTGVTSFIGSSLAINLLKKGHKIIFICRPKDNINAYQRVTQIFNWENFTNNENIHNNIKVIEGQITEDKLGLSDKVYDYLRENVDEIIHFAADTRFSETKKEQINIANIVATNHLLKLAENGKCYFFHYVSTAYSAGKKSGKCLEEYEFQDQFNNPYEESKHICEGNVLDVCKRSGIRVNIYRPSIVYGNAETGKSFRFNALYYPVKMVAFLKKKFEIDINENNGLLSSEMGVFVEKNDRINTSIRFVSNPGTSLNTVPVNYVVNAILAIMEESLEGDIFHLVSKKEDTVTWTEITENMREFLKLEGLSVVTSDEYEKVPQNNLEILFDSYIHTYTPYFNDLRIFDDVKARKILDKHNIKSPYMDYEIFEKVMGFAKEVDWGKDIFSRIKVIEDINTNWQINI